jgi:hypothetical protein
MYLNLDTMLLLFDMGFFGSTPPSVTPDEFKKKVLSQLYVHGFSQRERDEVEKIFHADLFEDRTEDVGIDAKELDRQIKWLKDHIGHHLLSAEKIDALEKVMRSYI